MFHIKVGRYYIIIKVGTCYMCMLVETNHARRSINFEDIKGILINHNQ